MAPGRVVPGASGADRVRPGRVGLDAIAFHPGAIRADERPGFRHEGPRREVLHRGGQWHDAVLMGLLRDERRPPTTT